MKYAFNCACNLLFKRMNSKEKFYLMMPSNLENQEIIQKFYKIIRARQNIWGVSDSELTMD